MKKIEQKDIDNMLGYEDFCSVTGDNLEVDGLPKGTNVFIAGTQAVPNDEESLYNFRLKMLVLKMDEGFHIDSTDFYLVDPDSLKRVSKRAAKKYRRILEKDFKKTEDTIIN